MAPSPLRSGDPERVGPYRVVARLGEGGMGAVYLGEAPEGRRVAVKVIRPDLASDPAFRARFRGEVERVRQVPPFCTAEVLDADAAHDPPYLVVELVDGPSLAEIVQERGPLTGGNLHSVAIGVTTALAAIHDAGVVHRDLKPANVLFAPLGTPKVIDFGIATVAGTTDHHTTPGQFFGTIAYMSPERLDAGTAAQTGTAADVFAWGAVVTYAATGHTPFAPEALVANAAGLPLPDPDLAGLPRALRGLVARALHEDPRHRPSAHELLEQLLRAGAAGDPMIRAGLAERPDLKRATAAVRHTESIDTAALSAPQAPQGRSPRRGIVAVAAAALIAGFGAYPAVQALVPGTGAAASPGAQSIPDARDAEDPASRATRAEGCTRVGPVDVTRLSPRPFLCPAPHRPAGQVIRARIRLGTPDACAAVWTHVTAGTDSYRTTVCARTVAVDLDGDGGTRPVASVRLDRPVTAAWHELEIRTPGQGIVVTLDGETTVERPRLAARLPHGSVVFGSTGAGVVTFAGVSVTSAP